MKELTLFDYLAVLKGHRRFLAGILGAAAVLTFLVCLVLPKKFESVATLMTASSSGSEIGSLMSSMTQVPIIRNLTSSFLASSDDRLMNVLKSRTVAVDVVKSLGLTKILFADLWDKQKQQWKEPDEAPTPVSAVSYMREKEIVKIEKEETGLFRIIVHFGDPEIASKIANEYLAAAQRFINNNTFSVAKKNRMFLENQLKESTQMLAEAEVKLKEFQETNKIVALDAQTEMTISALAEIKAQIMDVDIQLGMMEKTSARASQQYRRLLDQKRLLKKQLKDIEEKQKAVLAANKAVLPEKQQHQRKNSPLNKEALFVNLGEIPEVGLEYLRLKRNVLIQEQIFQLLTQQYEVAKIEEIKEEVAFTIFDNALPSRNQVFPRPLFFSVLAAFFAFFLSVLFLFVREYYDNIRKDLGVLKAV